MQGRSRSGLRTRMFRVLDLLLNHTASLAFSNRGLRIVAVVVERDGIREDRESPLNLWEHFLAHLVVLPRRIVLAGAPPMSHRVLFCRTCDTSRILADSCSFVCLSWVALPALRCELGGTLRAVISHPSSLWVRVGFPCASEAVSSLAVSAFKRSRCHDGLLSAVLIHAAQEQHQK